MNYREKIIHGNEGLPIAIYEIEPSHTRYRMILHWHPEHELVYIKSGTLHLRLNDVAYTVRAGDVIFIPGGTIHSGEPEDCVYTCVLVELQKLLKKSDVCMEFATALAAGQICIVTQLGNCDPGFAPLCAAMSDIHAQSLDGYPFAIKGLIFTLFGMIMDRHLYTEQATKQSASDRNYEKMKVAIAYMEQNCADPIRLETLAQMAGMSPNHFLRSFRTVAGVTPFAYLSDYRLTKACHDLRTTALSVTAIALGCGFSDASYFIYTFRRAYGVTPSQYREKNKP